MSEDSAETVTKATAKPLNDLAKAYRDELRAVAEHGGNGDHQHLGEAKSRAAAAWEELLARAIPAIERHARGQHKKESKDYEDFKSELALILYRELTDLRESKDLWQRKFNLLLERQAVKLAMRPKWKQQPAIFSLDEPISRSGDKAKGATLDAVRDVSDDERRFLIELDDILRWVAKKLSDRHLEVFKLRYLEELEWQDIGDRCEISEKTARNYYDQTKELLREIYSENAKGA